MKKIVVIIITVALVFAIYLINMDRKIYFLSIGDSISMGKTDNGIKQSYNDYVHNYLKSTDTIEKYVNQYYKDDLRINDIINDINNNRKISVNEKEYNIKNLLIKADLITISVNNNDLINKMIGGYTTKELYKWVEELTTNYEEMLRIIRDYCKEKVIIIGYYYPEKVNDNQDKIQIISHLNNSFKGISKIYNVDYLSLNDTFGENPNTVGIYYPTESGYKLIGEQIVSMLKTNY